MLGLVLRFLVLTYTGSRFLRQSVSMFQFTGFTMDTNMAYVEKAPIKTEYWFIQYSTFNWHYLYFEKPCIYKNTISKYNFSTQLRLYILTYIPATRNSMSMFTYYPHSTYIFYTGIVKRSKPTTTWFWRNILLHKRMN